MALFGIGNMLLKVRRARLPRTHRALVARRHRWRWPPSCSACSATSCSTPPIVRIFVAYFAGVAGDRRA